MLDQHVNVINLQPIELSVRALHVQQQAAKTGKVFSVARQQVVWCNGAQPRVQLNSHDVAITAFHAVVLAVAHIVVHIR